MRPRRSGGAKDHEETWRTGWWTACNTLTRWFWGVAHGDVQAARSRARHRMTQHTSGNSFRSTGGKQSFRASLVHMILTTQQ